MENGQCSMSFRLTEYPTSANGLPKSFLKILRQYFIWLSLLFFQFAYSLVDKPEFIADLFDQEKCRADRACIRLVRHKRSWALLDHSWTKWKIKTVLSFMHCLSILENIISQLLASIFPYFCSQEFITSCMLRVSSITVSQ